MTTVERLADLLQTTFGTLAQEAGKESGVIRRKRKFDATTLAKTFILALVAKPTANSEDIASMAVSVGVRVSPQAIDQRYGRRLNAFFRALFSKMSVQIMRSDTNLAPILKRFTSVKLIDSSVVCLPDCMEEEFPGCGGSGNHNRAALKLQTELDLASGQLQCVQLEAGKSPDQGTDRQHVPLEKGSLRIADLGYFSAQVLALYAQWEAFFLTRLLFNVRIQVDEQNHSLIDWLTRKSEAVIDCDVIVGQSHALACRMIAWRVPPEIAARRRREVRRRAKKKGRVPTQQRLLACDWNFLATNLPTAQLSVQEAIVLYRSRWQIELLFKRWKTYSQIDLMDGRTDAISMTRFWIRLCGALLQQWVVILAGWLQDFSLSFAKIAKRLVDWVDELASSLATRMATRRVLKKIKAKAAATCKRTRRREKPGTAELLQNPELLEFCLT